jgi:hypothetical protein
VAGGRVAGGGNVMTAGVKNDMLCAVAGVIFGMEGGMK